MARLLLFASVAAIAIGTLYPFQRPGKLAVTIRPRFRGHSLPFNKRALKTEVGQALSISRLDLLLTTFSLERLDGSRIPITAAAYCNLASGSSTFRLPNIPAGRYSALTFDVGVPPDQNHANPSSFPANSPLNPNVNGMHWSWKGGFVFAAIEGSYRAVLDPNSSTWSAARGGGGSLPRDGGGSPSHGFSFHIATDKLRTTIRVPIDVDIRSKPEAITIDFDLADVLDQIEIIQGITDSTHSGEGDTLAPLIASKFPNAFRFAQASQDETQELPLSEIKNPPRGTHPFKFTVPDGFPQVDLPADSPLTTEGIALGKRLFNEKRMSGNNTLSCAGCHDERYAFTDRRATSIGIGKLHTKRNAMPLFNLAWSPNYTWDGRRVRIRDQALMPIQDGKEMHETLPRVVKKLSASGYQQGFKRAFGTPEITAERISLAIEQYLLTIVSADSKFDRALKGQTTLTKEEQLGFYLFSTEYDPARGRNGADCFHCHGGALFTDYRMHDNGLDSGFKRDEGRGGITRRPEDEGKFKTPSLRNVAITGPYMHDGRIKTLEEVINHYADHVKDSDTLDPNLSKHLDLKLTLTPKERGAIVAFLKILTDPRFSQKRP